MVKVSPRGKVLSVRPLLAEGKLGAEQEHDRQTMQPMFAQYPDKVIEVGKVFTPEVGMHECKTPKCVELTTECRLDAADASSLTITTTGVEAGEPAARDSTAGANGAEPPAKEPLGKEPEPATRITMQTTVSRKDGLLSKAAIEGSMTMQMPGMQIESATEMTFTRRGDGR